MLISDTHLHSFFSSDSNTPMENMIKQGISLGLHTLCFTEHYDYGYPVTDDGLDFLLDFDAYYRMFLKMKEKYASQIELLHGIELGVQKSTASALIDLYSRIGGRYDFIINSCHLVDGIDPYEKSFFEACTPSEGIRRYFENILDNVTTYPYFQTAGHLDYICRYIPAPRPVFHYEDYGDILDAILQYLIDHEKGLEVNTAGLKHGLPWPNPHIEILKRYRALGGEIITIGSDAHRPEDMAYAFDKLPDMLSEIGFRYYTLYKEQRPCFLPLQ